MHYPNQHKSPHCRYNLCALKTPYLSIIIPAHNEAQRLPASLQAIHAFLQEQDYTAEVLVVENGSSDGTLEIARSLQQELPSLKVLHLDARGKGIAVKTGMLAAQGQYRFICDADLSMPIEQINRFFPLMQNNVDIAIASREAPGAVRYGEPHFRHLVGRVFNWMVRWLALPGLQDTQCGFKCFRAQVAQQIFPLQTIHGWTFDVEVLFIARKFGYSIEEIAIPWHYNPQSKVKFLRDSLHMGLDLFTIRLNDVKGVYAKTKNTHS